MLNSIIIEDEVLAAGLLADYIEASPRVKLQATFSDPRVALRYVQDAEVDVIFLDIHLPGMTGMQFMESLPDKKQIILTTAYHQYAVRSYDFDVVDYLLKPIEYPRFEQAVDKLSMPVESDHIVINVNKSRIKLAFPTIQYIESKRDYLTLNTIDGKSFSTKMTISYIDTILPCGFTRIHRSFIVNNAEVRSITSAHVELKDFNLPIGRKYKQDAKQILLTT